MASHDRQYSLNDNYALLNFTSYSAILTGGTPHEATFPGPVIKGYKVNTRVLDDTVITLADWSVFVATNSRAEVDILHTGITSRLKSQARDQLPTLH